MERQYVRLIFVYATLRSFEFKVGGVVFMEFVDKFVDEA